MSRGHEYGIGLDYQSLLGHATVFAEDDSTWVRAENVTCSQEHTRSVNSTLDIPSSTSANIGSVTGDFQHEVYCGWNTTINWDRVPLLTNIWTGNIPVAIHHNAHIRDLKTLREKWWPLVWFQPYARQMLQNFVNTRESVMRQSVLDGKLVSWTKGHRNHSVVSTFNQHGEDLGGISWENLIGGHEVELFRDEAGTWTAH